MQEITLTTIITKDFLKIKNNFKCASSKNSIKFDDDIFIDTYLKCEESLKKHQLNDEANIIRYFWVSYFNNMKKSFRTSKYRQPLLELNENYDIEDTIYDSKKYDLCDIINEEIIGKFGNDSHKLWILHFIEGKTYDELVNMGYNEINFHNLFRQINHYVKVSLPKQNPKIKKLIEEVCLN